MFPRRAQKQDSSPLGLEEMRCSGEGHQQNIAFYSQCIIDFNDEQRNAFNTIAACLADNYEGTKVFNINAPGGCGKTFLLSAILAHARGMGENVLLQLHPTLQILSMDHKILGVKTTNGTHIGNIRLISRIDSTPSESSLPFRMKRRSFPIRLYFAMTINKAQGQSINNLGVLLTSTCIFSWRIVCCTLKGGTTK